ncbi:MAG: hypothetical protein NC040_01455 [Muribaculaceae bacterium]|nr:hypothetical protein [Alistipes senegalensis]MCM1472695.1 hypothetical protein [Muribaculaceae bacterium]
MGLHMTQKERYRVRNEIENTIKEENIDRSKFHEVSKLSYENIIRKFYYTFFEYDKNIRYFEPEKIDLSYAWLNFRKNLKTSDTIRLHYDDTDINSIKSLIPDYSDNKKYFGIVADGWVYEGEISEILMAFSEIYFVTDFYIMSKKFDWVVVNCEDGECLWRVSSEKY